MNNILLRTIKFIILAKSAHNLSQPIERLTNQTTSPTDDQKIMKEKQDFCISTLMGIEPDKILINYSDIDLAFLIIDNKDDEFKDNVFSYPVREHILSIYTKMVLNKDLAKNETLMYCTLDSAKMLLATSCINTLALKVIRHVCKRGYTEIALNFIRAAAHYIYKCEREHSIRTFVYDTRFKDIDFSTIFEKIFINCLHKICQRLEKANMDLAIRPLNNNSSRVTLDFMRFLLYINENYKKSKHESTEKINSDLLTERIKLVHGKEIDPRRGEYIKILENLSVSVTDNYIYYIYTLFMKYLGCEINNDLIYYVNFLRIILNADNVNELDDIIMFCIDLFSAKLTHNKEMPRINDIESNNFKDVIQEMQEFFDLLQKITKRHNDRIAALAGDINSCFINTFWDD